jgi:hypothetical protein
MARSEINTEFNTFVGGILTEANPINYPVGYTLDEENFILERNGTRRRRPGIDIDSSLNDFNAKAATEFASTGSITVTDVTYKDYYVWNDAEFPDGTKDVLVLIYTYQYNSPNDIRKSGLLFYDLTDIANISDNFLDSYYLYDSTASNYPTGALPGLDEVVAMTSYRGSLIACDYSFVSDSFMHMITPVTSNTTTGTDTLKIVRRNITVRNLSADSGNTLGSARPSTMTDDHAYNLYNRGWLETEAYAWNTFDGTFPSLSDSMVFSKDKGGAFSTTYMDNTFPGNSSAPRGKAIVEIFDMTANFQTYAEQVRAGSASSFGDFSPTVDTDFYGNVTDAIESAGRVFYLCQAGQFKGFGNTILAFNNIELADTTSHAKCYSTNDPTSESFNQPLATDGGYLDVGEVGYGLRLAASRSKLLVYGSRGIYEVYNPQGIFTPSDVSFRKISNSVLSHTRTESTTLEGNPANNKKFYDINADSVVVAGDVFYYWSDNGVNILINDPQNDSFTETNISESSIKTLINSIPNNCKAAAKGIFLPEDNSVCWTYSLDTSNPGRHQYVLVYDITLKAWYKFRIANTANAYIVGTFVAPVNSTKPDIAQFDRVVFLCETSDGLVHANFTDSGLFSDYNNGADANEVQAFMQTGYLNANDSARQKQGTYIIPSFLRTEDGFTDDGSGNLTPTNESSCLISAWWDYVDDASLPKANDTFEAYKYNRLYIPSGPADTFDYGQTVLTTKNRLTGRGRALSLRFETSAGKDCKLLGWSLGFGANAKV